MKVLSGLVPEWFRPSQLEEGDEAEFEVKPITARKIAEVQNHYDTAIGEMRATGYYMAFELGIKDWKGVVDDEGNEVPFKLSNLGKIPVAIAMEVGAQVINVSTLSEEDRKN